MATYLSVLQEAGKGEPKPKAADGLTNEERHYLSG